MRKILSIGLACLMVMPAMADTIPEFCLENELTHRFLTEVQYKDGDYSYTKITDYYNVPTDYRKDQPAPVRLTWTPDKTYDSQKILISDAETNEQKMSIEIAANAESYDVYNLVPGMTYYYEISGSVGSEAFVIKSGYFKTTGTVRMLKIYDVYNVRDMGGWTGLGGRKVPYGKIIRGGRLKPNNSDNVVIDKAGIELLRSEGVRLEIDLRNEVTDNRTSPLGSDVEYALYEKAYNCRIVTYRGNNTVVSALQKIIDHLKKGESTYFHCSVGADRTGTLAFMTLALLGVDEDQLSKDFELSSFYYNPSETMLRMRTSDRYDYAGMMSDLLASNGENLQKKVYNYFKDGIDGTKITEADLDWFIAYMMDGYKIIKGISLNVGSTLTMNVGESKSLTVTVTPADATEAEAALSTVVFSSSNENVARVTEDGEIIAVRGGTAKISVKAGNFTKTVTVTVPLVETAMPATIDDDGTIWQTKTNLIKNGSFEYAGYFTNWTNVKRIPLTENSFDVKHYNEDGNDVYIESKSDTDASSIRCRWSISSGKTYAFGYRIRNTGGKTVNKNPNLETSLVKSVSPKIGGEGDDFQWDEEPGAIFTSIRDVISKTDTVMVLDYPSYDGEWTDVLYVFTNPGGYQYLQICFTNLSQDGVNTCFDDFYLTQIEDITAVPTVNDKADIGHYYNLSGQEIAAPGKGLYILDGKKYLNK